MNRREMLKASGIGIIGAGTLGAVDGFGMGKPAPKETGISEKKPPNARMKNIIIIKSDQLRWDFLGCMGSKIVKTPNIDKLAEDGFVLEKEFTVSTLCVPSRTSFFTGKYVHRTANTSNAKDEHIQPGEWSFVEPLKRMGYKIGIAGKNHAFSDEYFDKFFDYREETSSHGKIFGRISRSDKKVRKYLLHDPRDKYEKSNNMLGGLIPGPMPFPKEQCPAYRVGEDGVRFVEEHKDNRFFMYYSFADPHWPQVVPEPYYSMYDPDEMNLEAYPMDWDGHPFKHFVQSRALGFAKYSKKELQRILATYCGQVSFVDASVGMLIDKLKELGLYEDTVIVFTADHGDFGGRYGIIEKTGAFYEPLLRIPGVIKLPGIKGGKRIDAQISNIDVMPTIFDYLNISYPSDVQGISFLPVLKGERQGHRDVIFSEVGQPNMPPEPVARDKYDKYNAGKIKRDGPFWFCDFTTRGRMVMIRKDGWKYCYYVGDTNELYNVADDPYEVNNLVDEPKYAAKKQELKNELMEWLLTEPVKGI